MGDQEKVDVPLLPQETAGDSNTPKMGTDVSARDTGILIS